MKNEFAHKGYNVDINESNFTYGVALFFLMNTLCWVPERIKKEGQRPNSCANMKHQATRFKCPKEGPISGSAGWGT